MENLAGARSSISRRSAIFVLMIISAPIPRLGAGLLQLTRNYARELGPAEIRMNAISPGVIETDFS